MNGTPELTLMDRYSVGLHLNEADKVLAAAKAMDVGPDGTFLAYKGLITLLTIETADLLGIARRIEKPVNFTDGVVVDDEVRNVSDLIRVFRDAVCHTRSGRHRTEYGSAMWNVEFQVGGEHAIQFGERRILLQAHFARALTELRRRFDEARIFAF